MEFGQIGKPNILRYSKRLGIMKEALLWTKKPSQIINLGLFIQIVLLFILWMIIPFKITNYLIFNHIKVNHLVIFIFSLDVLYVIKAILTIMSIRYELTEERLLIYSGVLTQNQEEIELYRINDYKVVSPLYMRVFGIGNILVFSTDQTTPKLELVAIKDVYQVKDLIREKVENVKVKKHIIFLKS
jgi:uncharacterized membrane protein YdbT with pleckstrin-like domain